MRKKYHFEERYQRRYFAIIDRAHDRELAGGNDEYTEEHHVIPKALGGVNGLTVELTYREHFLVHWILAKWCKGKVRRKMQQALVAMMRRGKKRIVAGWQYAIAKRAARDASKGRKAPWVTAALKGRKRPSSVGRNVSAARRAGFASRKAAGLPLMKASTNKGRKHSPERCANMSAGMIASYARRKGQGGIQLKKGIAAAAVAAHPEKSNRVIAREVGVSHSVVSAARQLIEKKRSNSPQLVTVLKAIAAHPEKLNSVIAREIGCSTVYVWRARQIALNKV